jgi:hypothetical protein
MLATRPGFPASSHLVHLVFAHVWFAHRYTDSSFHGERYTLEGKTYDKLGNIDPVTGRECSDCGPAGYYYTQVSTANCGTAAFAHVSSLRSTLKCTQESRGSAV